MLQFLPKSIWSPRPYATRDCPIANGQQWDLADTLLPGALHGAAHPGERNVLAQLTWEPTTFTAVATDRYDADMAIDFPSPLPQGNKHWDTATLDWHYAHDKSGRTCNAPGVIVLDILLGGNRVANYIAKTLAKNGVHGFVLHLPQNGRRSIPGTKHDWSAFLPSLRQAAADARRARDVVANLPTVVGGVGLQGTSLGGFVATMAGSIDDAFESVILALTGGDVYGILSDGKMDARKVRQHLRNAGYTDAKLKDWLGQIEPLYVAHRLNPQKTWLFTARHDQVVPKIHSQKLAQTIGLQWSHHRQLAGCHYSCAINAHRFLREMVQALPKSNRVRAGQIA